MALSVAPSATATVAVASTNPAVTLSTSSFTFTTNNWNTAQSVTATAANDADAVDETATIRNSANGGGYAGVSASVQALVEDDEPKAGADYDPDNDGLAADLVFVHSASMDGPIRCRKWTSTMRLVRDL